MRYVIRYIIPSPQQINKFIYEVKQKERINMRELNICSFDYVPRLMNVPRTITYQDYEILKYDLRRFDINLIAIPPIKLKASIQMKIDPIPNKEITDVYSITFKTEKQDDLRYIGMTTRKFKERLREHMLDIKLVSSFRSFRSLL